jgi:sugar phosphate isomerase/epimerase
MIFGYNTNGFAHHRLADALCVMAQAGYGSVGLTLDHDFLDPYAIDLGKRVSRAKGLLQRFGLRSVVETGARFLLDPFRKHQPTLISPRVEERQQRLDFLLNAINIAREFGSDAVSFWSGAATDDATPRVLMERLVEACKLLCERAQNYQVRLAFEPEPGMFIDSMERFEELQKKVDHPLFGLTLDIGHLHCQGETPISKHIRRWKDHLFNVHIEDIKAGVHEHLMFGEGEIEFPPILKALEEIGYDRGVYVELSRHSYDAVNVSKKAIDFLKAQLAQANSKPA